MKKIALAAWACALVLASGSGSAPLAAAAMDAYQPEAFVQIRHPDWSRTAVLYQINTRQFTPEGTLHAAQAQLPRLKKLGVTILWLMPIHPIGEQNRKGTLGSPYAVRDYFAVNPELGTLADLKAFVTAAHGLGMRVILDWVGNHTAWDSVVHERHPDWYKKDWKGKERPTLWFDWSDIIDLDYSKPEVRRYMTDAMKYWVRTAGVDGFRCDAAGWVPIDFWENARAELDRIKPVFMLAEFDHRDVHRAAFDASYAWKWNIALRDIAAGKADVGALYAYYAEAEGAWPAAAQRMVYTENHDQNAWEGTEFERFGHALDDALVLSFVGSGIPLIYNGQEAGNRKRLNFFERDPIQWRDHPNADLFRKLIAFRTAHPALWNAPWGAAMIPVTSSAPTKVLSFVRQKDGDKVLALFNLSPDPQEVTLSDGPFAGSYRDFATGAQIVVAADSKLHLPAWSYAILSVEP